MRSSFSASIVTGLLVCQTLMLILLPESSAEREKRQQLPCNHPLRIIIPEEFTHCGSLCQYSSWSAWRTIRNSTVSVPVSQCPSGRAYFEERTRTTIGSGCTGALRENQTICSPTQEERLMLGLGLGGSGRNLQPFRSNQPLPLSNNIPQAILTSVNRQSSSPTSLPARFRRQASAMCSGSSQICRGIGKRSAKSPKSDVPVKKDVFRTDLNPIPFDWLEHGPSLRSKRQASTCGNQDTQHVLFVLDTSGSIGSAQFRRMKEAVGKLPALFCKQVKFAAVTFDTYIHREFCFNCFENTYFGRSQVKAALNNIPYRGGATYTAATARCICQEILNPSCGIEAYPDCLDVVFITDGQSNDRRLQVCDEIRCLHSRSGVDTYAIGINHFNRRELDCITDYSDEISAFEFQNFDAFVTAIQNIVNRLRSALPNSPESCSRLDRTISPTGSVPFNGKK